MTTSDLVRDVFTSEFARLLGVTPSAISKMVARGDLVPRAKVPGLRGPFIFDSDYVLRVIEAREQLEAQKAS